MRCYYYKSEVILSETLFTNNFNDFILRGENLLSVRGILQNYPVFEAREHNMRTRQSLMSMVSGLEIAEIERKEKQAEQSFPATGMHMSFPIIEFHI